MMKVAMRAFIREQAHWSCSKTLLCSNRPPRIYQRGGHRFEFHRFHYNSARSASPAKRNSLASTIASILVVGGFLAYQVSHGQGVLWAESPDKKERRKQPRIYHSMSEIDGILRWQGKSDLFESKNNLVRVDVNCLPSNEPCEDNTFMSYSAKNGHLSLLICGVCDGHAGPQTAIAVRENIAQFVADETYEAFEGDDKPWSTVDDPRKIDGAIRSGFLELDEAIMETARNAVTQIIHTRKIPVAVEPAYAGSCALMAHYLPSLDEMRIACVGDSRAVLGRCNSSGDYEATALSDDQTGYNQKEIARLEREHPSEPDMIKDGRLLGLAVTRAFGDSRWKWSREVQEEARDRCFGPELRKNLSTPPYLTAEPVITTTKLEPDRGHFIILASDGLWDRMTNQQAVDLVAMWLKENNARVADPISNDDEPTLVGTKEDAFLPATRKGVFSANDKVRKEDFTVRDSNAATHLIRNALGGADEEKLTATVTTSAPFARKIRDDISAVVIFLNGDPDTITLD